MDPRKLWPDNPIFIEIGVRNADFVIGLRREGYSKYLGVGSDERRIDRLQSEHPDLAGRLTASRRRKLVLNNNAEVLILGGAHAANVWKFRSVRHARWVAWRAGFGLFSLVALVGCLVHRLSKHYSWPKLVALRTPEGKARRLWVSRVVRRKTCRRKQLHFIPHSPGLAGVFRQFDDAGVRYAVLRWFDALPHVESDEDLDILVADDSVAKVIDIFESLPGILPCDLYSETGLARSDYCGTPYYPAEPARRILDGAVRHKGLCLVPSPWDHFHSLAYHAVYHKGQKSNLPRDASTPSTNQKPEHDYAAVLRRMAKRLGVDVEITFEDLHAYLEDAGWAPSPEMLARLAAATRSNRWVHDLAQRVPRHVQDQGLAVFVLRQEAVRQGFQSEIFRMIGDHGFELLAVRPLAPHEIEHAAARCRGGNWEEEGPFDLCSGGPATVVVAYDRHPLPLTRRQRRKFSARTNGRIFVKELIRDAIIAQLPPGRSFNALHSSDHAAEAWHLIEVLAPDLMDPVRARLRELYAVAASTPALPLRRAA